VVLRGDAAVEETVRVSARDDIYIMTHRDGVFNATDEVAALLTTDSTYTVTANAYTRYAPVNIYDAPRQVHFRAPRHFCYMAPGSAGYATVMGNNNDADFLVTRVEGGQVVFNIAGEVHRFRTQPQNGDFPFDFDYNPANGTIAHGHPGHALYGLA